MSATQAPNRNQVLSTYQLTQMALGNDDEDFHSVESLWHPDQVKLTARADLAQMILAGQI